MKFQSTNFTLHCSSLPGAAAMQRGIVDWLAVQVSDRLAENPKLEQNELPN